MPVDREKSQFKALIDKGKDQGYLTYKEVNDHLPPEVVDPEMIEDIVAKLSDMGITVRERAPTEEDTFLLAAQPAVDDSTAEEAAAVLASVDMDFGRTTDPVRMYMREMGTVELLTRQGEIDIAKRIEEGIKHVLAALGRYPDVVASLLKQYDEIATGEKRLGEIITGFIDDNIQPVIIQDEVDFGIDLDTEIVVEEEEIQPAKEIEPPESAEPLPETDVETEAEDGSEGEGETDGEAGAETSAEAKEAVEEVVEEEAIEADAVVEELESGPDPEEARKRFDELRELYEKFLRSVKRNGRDHKAT
ncbi:MAG: hypothetical protein M3R00_07240, partial [Pseudomonadota bacterium]|nr:hypothetical protein [Pseudomonadota bacterium]